MVDIIRSEIHFFVSWITSFIAYAIYLFWAFMPESVLLALGITYYPSRYWALAIPSYVIVTTLTYVAIYNAINLAVTPSLDALCTMRDAGPAGVPVDEMDGRREKREDIHREEQWKEKGGRRTSASLGAIMEDEVTELQRTTQHRKNSGTIRSDSGNNSNTSLVRSCCLVRAINEKSALRTDPIPAVSDCPSLRLIDSCF